MRVLIVGGYRMFGGRLARLLIKDGLEAVVVKSAREGADGNRWISFRLNLQRQTSWSIGKMAAIGLFRYSPLNFVAPRHG